MKNDWQFFWYYKQQRRRPTKKEELEIYLQIEHQLKYQRFSNNKARSEEYKFKYI